MRLRIAIAVLAGLCAFGALSAWKMERLPAVPSPASRPMADMGTVKSDLFIFARAEQAFFASTGHYASMQELRSNGLLSLPPDVRWPYFYSVHTARDRFVIVAMAEGPFGRRPIAVVMDDDFNMRAFDSHQWPRQPRRHRRRLQPNYS